MIVADTSVWIDLLNQQANAEVEALSRLVKSNVNLYLTGVIVAEILQGVRSEKQAAKTSDALSKFPLLELQGHDDYREAARLYRAARASGVTVTNMADLLIAVPCIREGAWLLHRDSDFDRLATCSGLKILKID